jgi:hypothetical protein
MSASASDFETLQTLVLHTARLIDPSVFHGSSHGDSVLVW